MSTSREAEPDNRRRRTSRVPLVRGAGFALLLFSLAASAAPRPTRAAIRKAFESNRNSLVEVVGPKGRGPGVIVGNSGQILTSDAYVGREEAQVRRRGEIRPAQVNAVLGDARVALVRVDTPSSPAVPVNLVGEITDGTWLIALRLGTKGRPEAVLVEVLSTRKGPMLWQVDRPLAPGCPLFDTRGQLVALATRRDGNRTWAAPMAFIKAALEAQP